MKALNHQEIIQKYLLFLVYLTLLLTVTFLCFYLFHQTSAAFTSSFEKAQMASDSQLSARAKLSAKLDSLNTLLKTLNTKQVKNELALEKAIVRLKRETLNELDQFESNEQGNYILYRKLLEKVELALDNKKNIQQAKIEEENDKKKLQECMEADKNAQKALGENATTP